MIGILINDKDYLDVDNSVNLEMEFHSPIFNENAFLGSWTYNFSLPLSAKNKKLLDHPHILENSKKTQSYDVQLFLDNVFFEIGTLTVSDIGTRINCRMGIAESSFLFKAKNKTLKDLDFWSLDLYSPETSYNPLAYFKYLAENPDIDNTIVFYPYENKKLGDNFDSEDLKDNYNTNAFYVNYYKDAAFVEDAFAVAGHWIIYNPAVYVAKLVEEIFIKFGINIQHNEMRYSNALKWLTLLHCSSINEQVFPTLNLFQDTVNFSDIVPDVLIVDFLKALKSTFLLIPFINNGKMDYKSFFSISSLNKFYDFGAIVKDSLLPSPRKGINYKLSLANPNKDDYFKDNVKAFDVDDYESFSSGAVLPSWTTYPTPGSLFLCTTDNFFYEWVLKDSPVSNPPAADDFEWVKVSFNFYKDYNSDDSIEETVAIESVACTALNNESPFQDELYGSSRKWFIPRIEQPIWVKYIFNTYDNDPEDIRFLNYLGMQEDSNGWEYPMASYAKKLPNGSTATTGTHLEPDSTSGGLTDWHEAYKRIVADENREFSFQKAFNTITELKNAIKFDRKWQIDGRAFFIKSLKISYSNASGLGIAEVEAVQI
jgi:hypothetical protein